MCFSEGMSKMREGGRGGNEGEGRRECAYADVVIFRQAREFTAILRIRAIQCSPTTYPHMKAVERECLCIPSFFSRNGVPFC